MKIFRPRCIHVRIASGCNLACKFCERENLPEEPGGTRGRGTLTFQDGRSDLPILSDMVPATWNNIKSKLMPNVDHMELGGLGEPTLGKIFSEAAADILSAGKSLFFFTNGHFLDKPHVLKAVGETPHISVSIDAGTPDAYRRIRGGELQELIDSVKAFRAAKPGAIIDSQFTAVADNIDELPAWVQLCADLGIGRTDFGEQLLVNGADHHVTSRVDQSVRFHKDRTEAALAAAVQIAQANRLWLMSNLPKFSELNPNAATDGSDPRKLRRWSDLMFYGANPCGGGDTSAGSVGQTSIVGPPAIANPFAIPGFVPAADEPKEIVVVGKELYIDYDGQVWSCLARHSLGNVNDSKATWETLVDNNRDYQEWLANWHFGTSMNNSTCKACPRRK